MSFNTPEHWKWQTFESLLSEPLRNGIYKKKEFHGSGAKIVNMGELFKYPRLKEGVDMKRVELTKNEVTKATLEQGDLIFARRSLTAEGAGKCSIVLAVDEPTTFESSIIRARLNSQLAVPEFYYYLFNSPFGKWLLGTILRQVAVSGITGSDLAKLNVPVPPIEEQQEIIKCFRNIDDKIELNRQINQTLEQVAQAIFKSWFVDFEPVKAKIAAREALLTDNPTATAEQIAQAEQQAAIKAISGAGDVVPTEQLQTLADLFPNQLVESELGEIPEGWSFNPFSKIAKLKKGKNITKKSVVEGSVPVVAGGLKPAYFHNCSNVAGPTITVSASGANAGFVNFYFEDIWASDCSFLNFQMTEFIYFCYTALKVNQKRITDMQTGAAQPHIYPKDFDRLIVAEAPRELIATVENIFSNLFKKIANNKDQINVLSDLRDVLLPKLLSGEIELTNKDVV